MFLVVEDEPLTLRALERFFARYGEVIAARTAEEAYRALHGGRPIRGCVTDWRLGEVDGLVLARYAWELLEVPILVITAHDDPGPAETAHQLGLRFTRKPPPRETLVDFAELSDPGRRSERRLRRRLAVARELATEWALPDRLREILLTAVENDGDWGATYAVLLERSGGDGYSSHTFKNQVWDLLERVRPETRCRTLRDLHLWICAMADP